MRWERLSVGVDEVGFEREIWGAVSLGLVRRAGPRNGRGLPFYDEVARQSGDCEVKAVGESAAEIGASREIFGTVSLGLFRRAGPEERQRTAVLRGLPIYSSSRIRSKYS